MKKALPILAVVALIAAALFFFLKKSGQLDLAPGRAAELAPADTLLFIEFPDMGRSKSRWKETALRKIGDEPEWKEFTAKWDDFKAENPQMRDVNAVFDQIERADPAGLFLAFNSFDGNFPKAVGGFPYRGKKSDVQAVVSKLRGGILASFPAAKSELTSYEGTEIETLKDKDMTLSMAYRDNWFLFATDTEMLLKTLSRYIRKPDAPAGLAGDALWKDTIKQGTRDPDMTIFLRWEPLMKKFEELAALASPGQAMPMNPNKVESMLYSAKMDGLLMRDHFYVRAGKVPKVETFANRSAAFTSPATYAYAGGQVAFAGEPMKETIEAMDKATGEAAKSLATKGLKLADLFTTFGPEIAMLSDWESGGLSLPTFFAAVEIRDKAKARLFADLLVEGMDDTKKATKSEEGGTTFWTMPADVALFQPTIALNDKHLAFGLNAQTAKAAMKQAQSAKADVPGRADYQAALKTVTAPKAGMLYLDVKTLFERLYEKLKPMAAFAVLGQPEVAKYFDPSKLPKTETISRHLSPMLISWAEAENGTQMDCAGPVSLIQAYVPLVGGTAFFAFRSFGMMSAPPPPAPPAPTVTPAELAPVAPPKNP